MAKSDSDRYKAALKYLRAINAEVALEVDQLASQTTGGRDGVGAGLSLKGIWSKGHLYRSQHEAMRALLLCQAIYLKPPWARQEVFVRGPQKEDGGYDIMGGQYNDYNLEWKLDVPTSAVRNMSESQINELIGCYAAIPTASAARLGDVANENPTEGLMEFRTLTRTGPTVFGKMSICYDGVRMWLFKAGFVSIRWLTHQGPSLIARTANQLLGNGVVIAPDQLNNIPRGHIFNFHEGTALKENKEVCHWGVSLGGGMGAATNTTDEEKGTVVRFIRGSGPSKYGVFRLSESFEVCKLKYGGEARIRKIDPTTIPGLY